MEEVRFTDRKAFIEAAWNQLSKLTQCPKCGNSVEDTIIATHSTGLGDVECTHCDHPFHATRYRRAIFETFDRGWVNRTYDAMYRYAVFDLKMD